MIITSTKHLKIVFIYFQYHKLLLFKSNLHFSIMIIIIKNRLKEPSSNLE